MNYRIVADSSANILSLPGQNYATVPMKVNADKEYVDDAALNLAEMVEAQRLPNDPVILADTVRRICYENAYKRIGG